MPKTTSKFTAVYKKSGKHYLGWVEEIPGANTQGETLKEAKENLKEALEMVHRSHPASSQAWMQV